MKALTVRQPWASLIFREMDLPFGTFGTFKQVETRSWQTGYRGRLAIHAAKTHDKGLLDNLDDDTRMTFASAGICCEADIEALPHGAVIGEVDLIGCQPIELLSKYRCVYEETFGDWSDGRFGWLLKDPTEYKQPIPAVGKLGLWEWEGKPDGEAVQTP